MAQGYRARNFAQPVSPCTSPGSGRVTAAEWVRTAFHDMATGNVVQGTGGLDASIVYELKSSDNAGSAFNSSLTVFEPFYSPQSSLSDLIALGLRTAVRACGGPVVPLRIGRLDATTSGSSGVPQPQNAIGTFQNQFQRMGFNDSGMITLVACGHTFGAVHASNQPLIVAPGSAPPYDAASMDSSSSTFDNRIATEYISGNTTNPLVVGLSVQNKRNSDKVVFQVDKNATIQKLTDPTYFQTQCQAYLQQMIEVVPKSVILSSDFISPYECKPYNIQLYLQGDGTTLAFSGEVRIRTTSRPASSISKVQLTFKDRNGGSSCGTCVITAQSSGSAAGLDDTFAFYGFSTSFPTTTSISSFTVTITKSDGSVETFNNGGAGFPVQDTLLLQSPQTCSKVPGTLQISAALRTGTTGQPVFNAITKSYTSGIIRPTLNTTSVLLNASSTLGQYSLYSAILNLDTSQITSGTRYNLTIQGQTVAVSYKDLANIPTSCAAAPSSSSASTWTTLGCFTDSTAGRTLDKAGYGDDSAMTTKSCASYCKLYQYFGTEYSRECFCGNSINPSSMNASNPAQSCNMQCTGDSTQTCGGSGYLNLYQNPTSNLPSSPSNVGSYGFLGCYTDSQSVRALPDTRRDDSALTIDACATFCASGNYKYMGTEYSGECYCAQQLASFSTKASLWDCNMACNGNSSQACGAANRLTLYQTPSTSKRSVKNKRHTHGHANGHALDHS